MPELTREQRSLLAYHRAQGGMRTADVARSMGVAHRTAKRLIEEGASLPHKGLGARVVALREEHRMSWRAIADELGLGTPGTARRHYRQATGITGPLERLPGKGGRTAAA